MVAAAPILLATRSESLKTNVVPVTCGLGQLSKRNASTIELSPDTAKGVRRSVIELSPTCAHHKASQPHRKPVHPTSLPPPPTPPRKTLAPARWRWPPSTTSLQMIPQLHTCGTENTRFNSKHSNVSSRQLSSPHTHQMPQTLAVPHSLHNITPTHRTCGLVLVQLPP
jgi:hypothetical protein